MSGPSVDAAPAPAPNAHLPRIVTRPWALAPEHEREVFRALRFGHFKWDTFACGGRTVLPETIVIDAALHAEVVATVEALHHALLRFEQRVRREPEALQRLGIPAALHPLIARESERVMQLARYDLFPTVDGRLMVSEFNEDVPGGFNESQGLPELLGDAGAGCRWEPGPRDRFLDAFRDFETVALLYATAFTEDLQHMLILERWLLAAGHTTVLGSPQHLATSWRGRPRILGDVIDAVFRFYPGEWMPKLPNFDTWLRLGPRLPMMNPVRHLVRQSKICFALWLEDTGLDAADRALVERHCPLTVPFDAAWADRLRDERERWVLKRAFGRMGDSVVLGCLVDAKEWDATIREAARSPGEWCVQERFVVETVPFSIGPLYPTLGAYVVNGRFAGYYSRAAPRPFLTHEALHVTTAVRSA